MNGKLVLLFFVMLAMTSCSIFKKVKTDKEKLRLDSVTNWSNSMIKIDTGSMTSYTKLTIKAGGKKNVQNPFSGFYPRNLVSAAENIAEAVSNLKNGLEVPATPRKGLSEPNKANMHAPRTEADQDYDITFENWTKQQNGQSEAKSSNGKTDVGKKVETDKSISEGSPKNVLILCIVVAFVVIILGIFIFLYYKSGNSLKDLFKFKK